MSNIYLMSNYTALAVSFTTFSDGAENCALSGVFDGAVRIVAKIEDCTRDIMRVLLVKEALEALSIFDVALTINYFPNARCDRRFHTSEAFPLKVYAKLINDCNFTSVMISDPHSDVTTALLNRVRVTSQKTEFVAMGNKITNSLGKEYVICAPDVGASKKAHELGHYLTMPVIQAYKNRDQSTGQIISTTVDLPDNMKGKDVLIVDDICDGGATFKYLADELIRVGAKSVSLYVTHGIFAKGLEPLKSISKIFVSHLSERYINIRDIQLFNER